MLTAYGERMLTDIWYASEMVVTYDERGRGAGKSHDLAWRIVEHIAETAWTSDEPERIAAVLVVPEMTWLTHTVYRDVLMPHRSHICVATPTSLERTRGVRDVPWFADDVDLFNGGLGAVVDLAHAARAPSLHYTSSVARP